LGRAICCQNWFATDFVVFFPLPQLACYLPVTIYHTHKPRIQCRPKYERLPHNTRAPSSTIFPLALHPRWSSSSTSARPSRMARERETESRTAKARQTVTLDSNVPPPSAWKRIGLLSFSFAFLFWFGFYVRPAAQIKSCACPPVRNTANLLVPRRFRFFPFRSLHPFSLLFHLFPPSCAHTTVSFLLCYVLSTNSFF